MKFTGTFTKAFIRKTSPEVNQEIFKAISQSAFAGEPQSVTTDSINYFLEQAQISGYKNVYAYFLNSELFEVVGWTGDLLDGIDWLVNVRVANV